MRMARMVVAGMIVARMVMLGVVMVPMVMIMAAAGRVIVPGMFMPECS